MCPHVRFCDARPAQAPRPAAVNVPVPMVVLMELAGAPALAPLPPPLAVALPIILLPHPPDAVVLPAPIQGAVGLGMPLPFAAAVAAPQRPLTPTMAMRVLPNVVGNTHQTPPPRLKIVQRRPMVPAAVAATVTGCPGFLCLLVGISGWYLSPTVPCTSVAT